LRGVRRRAAHRDHGGPRRDAQTPSRASQEIDQVRIFSPIKSGRSGSIGRSIVESLRQAFNVARSGKPGPVLVDIPQDILASDIEFSDYRPVGKPAKSRGDAVQIKAAAAALLVGETSLIVSGGVQSHPMLPRKWCGLQKRSRSLSPRPWQGVASCLTIMSGRRWIGASSAGDH